MSKKKHIKIGNRMVEVKKTHQLPDDADFFTRASYLIAGRIKPVTEQDRRIIAEAKEIEKKGGTIDIPFN